MDAKHELAVGIERTVRTNLVTIEENISTLGCKVGGYDSEMWMQLMSFQWFTAGPVWSRDCNI
jgi:hypothetical protein